MPEAKTLTEAQAEFVRGANYAVVAVQRPDGSIHQSVIWVDWDGEHVLVNLNTWRRKLGFLHERRVASVLVVDRDDPYRWIALDGPVDEITTDGANEHIVHQAGVYRGRREYALRAGEQRVLVKLRPTRVSAYGV